jgi:hypothetical protein
VVGYLLFDWLVTDVEGNATAQFALDSSYHVLWKLSQRDPGPNDSAPRAYTLRRGSYGYPAEAQGTEDAVSLYAEWEPTRPLPGSASLPTGQYEVFLNLTEESFHSDASIPQGGLWAQVLRGPIVFTVTGAQAAATHRGMTLSAFQAPWSWLRGMWSPNRGRGA